MLVNPDFIGSELLDWKVSALREATYRVDACYRRSRFYSTIFYSIYIVVDCIPFVLFLIVSNDGTVF